LIQSGRRPDASWTSWRMSPAAGPRPALGPAQRQRPNVQNRWWAPGGLVGLTQGGGQAPEPVGGDCGRPALSTPTTPAAPLPASPPASGWPPHPHMLRHALTSGHCFRDRPSPHHGGTQALTRPAARGQRAGGWNPPTSSARRSAKAIAVSSSYSGPKICTPTGRPPGVRPPGATTAGRPGSDACEIQNGWSR
jgi:hypothetical protein